MNLDRTEKQFFLKEKERNRLKNDQEKRWGGKEIKGSKGEIEGGRDEGKRKGISFKNIYSI